MGAFALSISTGWSYGLKLPSPAPFYGLVVAYITLIFGFIPLWYLFPSAWRKEKDIRRKFKFFLLAIAVNFAVTLIYTMYTKAFIKDYGKHTANLLKLINQVDEKGKLPWDDENEEAFQKLKYDQVYSNILAK